MTTALTTTSPSEIFRGKASKLISSAANLSLHDLVDEFVRLTDVMDQNTIKEDNHYPTLNDDGHIAIRERGVINAAIKARFGISIDSYDRTSSNSEI